MKINKKLYVAVVLFLALLIISISAFAFATAPGKEPVQPLGCGIDCPNNGECCNAANCPMKEGGTCPKEDGACMQNGACPKDEACQVKGGGANCPMKEGGACPKNDACTMKGANTCQMGEKKPDYSMVAAPVPGRACPMGGGAMGGACRRKGF